MASWFSFGATAQSEVWPSGLVALHAISDGIIALSFFAIPLALLYIYRRRGETNPGERMLIILFALFIFAVGLAHLASLFTLLVPGLPGRGFEGLLKALGALLALTGAVAIWRLAPHLLQLPSRDRLQAEVAAHLRTFAELKDSRHQLEERVDARTKELDEAKQRFEIALRGTPISVFSQDKDLRFTWVHNPPTGVSPDMLLGKTDAEILPPEAAAKIMAAKRKVMKTGEAQELESNFELFGRKRSFYLLIEALRDEGGDVLGTTSVAVDISERKANEDQLRLLLRELTHRCKNLLAVIHAIARQTASRTRSVEDFLDRFSARLAAMGASHDLLIADDWQGASLRMLVEQQLGEHAERFGGQIAIEGEDVMLKPEAVQNLGLALHELATNAHKYGSLSEPAGEVNISWQFCDDASKLKLVWQERGGPKVTPPERSGFGRAMIENVVSKALEGDVRLSFPPKGVRCVIEIPVNQVTSRG
ncbi:MAG TPA: HWE histidine kinase domain-containing protein [Methyloceanibacter sp.]|nr:HWE histidine kinase domain-containing protein [Methyloceanibacter sp.]